jgi:gamma-F420-2:alpha-L-glutamate ligase
MKGWILYRDARAELTPESYEMHRFLDAAAARDIELDILRPEQLDLIVTRDDRKSIRLKGEVTPLPDFLLPRQGAATPYFALAVIRHLERLGVLVLNRSDAIEAVKDKLYTQQILAASNLPVPKTMLVKFPIDVELVKQQLGFPVVVKTVSGSKGSGVYLAETPENFADLMTLIESTRSNANIILQQFITSSRGRDLRVFIVGGRAIACMQRIATDGNFKANISRGGEARPYPMSPEIEMLALEAARRVGLDIAGVDLLFDEDHFKDSTEKR